MRRKDPIFPGNPWALPILRMWQVARDAQVRGTTAVGGLPGMDALSQGFSNGVSLLERVGARGWGVRGGESPSLFPSFPQGQWLTPPATS